MVHAKNYETASTFLLKLLRENYWLLFSGHGVGHVYAFRVAVGAYSVPDQPTDGFATLYAIPL